MSRRPSVVTLYASEIGCILEKNPFCSRTEILKRVWYRMAGECTPLSCRPNLDQLKMVSRTKPGRAFKDQKYDIKDHAKFDDIVISLKNDLSSKGHKDLMDAAAGFARTEIGKNSEKVAVALAESHPEVGQCRSIQERFSKLAWCSKDRTVQVAISGRIDCLDENGRVVEIKTRVRRKPCVTDTESIQLQTYLFLANVSSGYIIELYNDDQDGKKKLVKNPSLEFDDRWWNDEVVPALSSLVDDLLTSMQAGCIIALDGF